jgi:pre-mRNA-processing factor SLU7
VGQKVDTKSRVTVRNLRIREDTAKYLLNLDVNSAEYDPKTRSMRDPNKPVDPDAFIKADDASKMKNLQSFAWEAEKRGKQVHINANPTLGELMYKQFKEKQTSSAIEQKTSILAKYGGEEHLMAPPKELLMAQTEHYVEYAPSGELIKGQEAPKIRSKYPEDM